MLSLVVTLTLILILTLTLAITLTLALPNSHSNPSSNSTVTLILILTIFLSSLSLFLLFLVANENICKTAIFFFEIHFKMNGELCKWCLKSFATKGNLNRHSRSVHLKEYWVCDMCEGVFVKSKIYFDIKEICTKTKWK